MFSNPIIRSFAIALLAVSFVFSPEVAGAEVTKRIVFPKGKTSVLYKGRLPREYAVYDAYLLRARKGQTLSVKLTTSDPDANLSVFETQKLGPEEDGITPADSELRQWSGRLPVTSEYSVQIYGVNSIDDESSGATYTVEISLR